MTVHPKLLGCGKVMCHICVVTVLSFLVRSLLGIEARPNTENILLCWTKLWHVKFYWPFYCGQVGDVLGVSIFVMFLIEVLLYLIFIYFTSLRVFLLSTAVCPLVFPKVSPVLKGCGNGMSNQTACCNTMASYVSHLQKQSFTTNLQALDCAASLGMKLQKANITKNVYNLCHISLKDFSLQG